MDLAKLHEKYPENMIITTIYYPWTEFCNSDFAKDYFYDYLYTKKEFSAGYGVYIERNKFIDMIEERQFPLDTFPVVEAEVMAGFDRIDEAFADIQISSNYNEVNRMVSGSIDITFSKEPIDDTLKLLLILTENGVIYKQYIDKLKQNTINYPDITDGKPDLINDYHHDYVLRDEIIEDGFMGKIIELTSDNKYSLQFNYVVADSYGQTNPVIDSLYVVGSIIGEHYGSYNAKQVYLKGRGEDE